MHAQVVLAYGAESDKRLGIPGEVRWRHERLCVLPVRGGGTCVCVRKRAVCSGPCALLCCCGRAWRWWLLKAVVVVPAMGAWRPWLMISNTRYEEIQT